MNEPKVSYQSMLDETLAKIRKNIVECGDAAKPSLLLHSCCGPCSSYVLEYLVPYFNITVLYYNPCIYPTSEYEHRKAVQKELIRRMNENGEKISFVEADAYAHESEHAEFLRLVAGHESDPECGERCHICYEQRLVCTARYAKDNKFDYFTTTLTVSPYKKADILNSLGAEISDRYGISYLFSDFKKKEGYKRSIELSKVYGLYRQEYCGCEFSNSKID